MVARTNATTGALTRLGCRQCGKVDGPRILTPTGAHSDHHQSLRHAALCNSCPCAIRTRAADLAQRHNCRPEPGRVVEVVGFDVQALADVANVV